ncbi:hypothetical protein HGG74_07295 [Arthrobacter sp. E918]|uniref:DUF4352 domain-containing protein n=1 Tax=Arthrobacter mobilis TaxID=2724944 RepID=A0A7X6HE67_9MICC|nr:hypothetical protein [Arthrobacter mobilis]
MAGAAVAASGAGLIAGSGTAGASGPASGGVRTSFGSVRLTGAERQARLGSGAAAAAAGHGGHGAAVVSGTAQPANRTWGDHLALQLEVRNDTDHEVLFSPGQLRLKVGPDGPSVTNRGSDAAGGLLAAGATQRYWISFLAPSGAKGMAAEFTDPWLETDRPLALALPPVVRRPGSLNEGATTHG